MGMPSYTPQDAAVPEGIVVIERNSTPQSLGAKLNRTAADVVRFLLTNGEMVTATQSLSDEMIELFAEEIGAEISLVNPGEEQEVELQKVLDIPEDDEEEAANYPHRAPVITVMGHVDHGKTKLLDRIRNANVVAGEAGGITQAIGAYQVVKNGHPITFLDTPGHEAFTAMRARGADATDIVILVVAADDGVMPQTIEAIQHAKAAEVPIVVAVNKIDREGADVDKVLSQLSEHGLVPESWGGDTVVCQVSALQEIGIDELLDSLLLVAEVEDLRAKDEGRATGVVLESHLDIGRGPVATVLVQRGTLRQGEIFVAGATMGRVRAMFNDRGERISEATPSTAVQILGFEAVPSSGDNFQVVEDDGKARQIVSFRQEKAKAAALAKQRVTLENLFSTLKEGQIKELPLIIKGDTQGSVESIVGSLERLGTERVRVRIIHAAAGTVTENDVLLAEASKATIIAFQVKSERKAEELANEEGVDLRFHDIIYKVTEEVSAAMLGLLEATIKETVQGQGEVRQIFKVNKTVIAGSFITEGKVQKSHLTRVLRGGEKLWEGSLKSLKRYKEDVHEVKNGLDCGISLEGFDDLKEGDVLEFFTREKVAATTLG